MSLWFCSNPNFLSNKFQQAVHLFVFPSMTGIRIELKKCRREKTGKDLKTANLPKFLQMFMSEMRMTQIMSQAHHHYKNSTENQNYHN